MRKVFASKETAYHASKSPNKRVEVLSLFPIDKADCECAKTIRDFKLKLAMMNDKERQSTIASTKQLVCPRNKTNMQRYEIRCVRCKEVQGYCYATDATLKDWCDFHYVQWTDGEYWRGCFTPNISPITEELTIECCCGQDTRDFRANMTMNTRIAERKETQNAKGRQYNQYDSKFAVNKVPKNVIR